MATLTLSPSLASSHRVPAALPVPARLRSDASMRTVRPGQPVPADVSAPLRLTRRGRLVVTLAMLMVSAVVGLLGSVAWSALASDSAAAGSSEGQEYVVTAGDTLWSIAAAHAGGGDVRATMYAIKQGNDLASSAVVPGQVLVLPTR